MPKILLADTGWDGIVRKWSRRFFYTSNYAQIRSVVITFPGKKGRVQQAITNYLIEK